jgi:hypothetical protein
VHPHSPAAPPPPQVSVPLQLQLIVPLQPSETLPQSGCPSGASNALQVRGVQHVEVDLTHSSLPVQAQLMVPPHPSIWVPQVPAG